jgi:K+-transporting ATPase c subunit
LATFKLIPFKTGKVPNDLVMESASSIWPKITNRLLVIKMAKKLSSERPFSALNYIPKKRRFVQNLNPRI